MLVLFSFTVGVAAASIVCVFSCRYYRRKELVQIRILKSDIRVLEFKNQTLEEENDILSDFIARIKGSKDY
jgi:hypothetical protein